MKNHNKRLDWITATSKVVIPKRELPDVSEFLKWMITEEWKNSFVKVNMNPEEWWKTIIVLWNDNWMRQAIAKFLKWMHPEDWEKILGTENDLLNEWKQPDLSNFLKWMHTENLWRPAKKVKKKVSEILD
ncbi:MAG: hypothetical protein ACD_49C00009G0025 [uncultured bacterium (gcode 4)]|uniref:Uncharacterized protein n=1 Tax=uncultured bacterium (gcode 4) TaxID=1234023 RepID=K2AFL6_9BACT|nr:MAG: hypothetical protein ACD_49C00009G0025 [uncultured bacterium (gcode 4)]